MPGLHNYSTDTSCIKPLMCDCPVRLKHERNYVNWPENCWGSGTYSRSTKIVLGSRISVPLRHWPYLYPWHSLLGNLIYWIWMYKWFNFKHIESLFDDFKTIDNIILWWNTSIIHWIINLILVLFVVCRNRPFLQSLLSTRLLPFPLYLAIKTVRWNLGIELHAL